MNARAKTLIENPAFMLSFEKRRCVTWATGYYEWLTTSSGKQSYYIHFADHRPFFFYGIWQTWHHPESKRAVHTFAIITTESAEHLAFIDDLMPCIVDVDSPDVGHWLDHSDDRCESRLKLLHPYENEKLIVTPVSKYVNNKDNQGPECIEPDQGGLF